MDWIDDILASEPISNTQIAIIEGLLTGVPYEQEVIRDIESGLLHLTMMMRTIIHAEFQI